MTVTLDPARYGAYVDGEFVKLTRGEYKVLAKLAETPGEYVLLEDLVAHYWDLPETNVLHTRAVNTQVHRLRQKIGPALIGTRWGRGYYLDLAPEAVAA